MTDINKSMKHRQVTCPGRELNVRRWKMTPVEASLHSKLWHHHYSSFSYKGSLLINYSSFVGSGATEAELFLAAAPLLSLAFSFLSWLSILACSCFTRSSSSAWREERAQRRDLTWGTGWWTERWLEENDQRKEVRPQRWLVTTTSHRKIINRLPRHFKSSHHYLHYYSAAVRWHCCRCSLY